MTYIMPRRRTILHFPHMGLTLARTFIKVHGALFCSIRNPPFGRVVGRHLKLNPIPGHDANEMDPHLAGQMAKDDSAIGQLHPKQGIGEALNDFSLYFNATLMHHTKSEK